MHAPCSVQPDFCEINYSYSETKLANGRSAIKKLPANNDRTSVFEYTLDNSPVSPVQQIQTVTINVSTGSKYGLNKAPRTDVKSW